MNNYRRPEDPEDWRLHKSVLELRRLVAGENGLVIGNDDRIYIRYLRLTNFDVETAFEKMKFVYKLKAENREWYASSDKSHVHDILLRRGIHVMLEDRDLWGRRIYVIRLGNVVVGEVSVCEMFHVDDLWLEMVLDEEETQRNGIAIILDMAGLSWRFMRYFTPHTVKVSSSKSENIPLQHVQYHVVNSGILLNSMVSIVFPFLSDVTKENIHFHKCDWSSLHQYINPEALPKDYGGLKPALDHNKCREQLDRNWRRVTELLSFGYTWSDKRASRIKEHSQLLL